MKNLPDLTGIDLGRPEIVGNVDGDTDRGAGACEMDRIQILIWRRK